MLCASMERNRGRPRQRQLIGTKALISTVIYDDMAKSKANSLPPLEQGIVQLRATRVIPTAAHMAARIQLLPDVLRKVVLASFESFGSCYVPKVSAAIFKLAPADQRKIFAVLFPEYPDALVAGLTDLAAFPMRAWYPYRAPRRPKEHIPSCSRWWGTLALLRLEFPELDVSLEALVPWAAYAGLSAKNDDKNALGRLFAIICRQGGTNGHERFSTNLDSKTLDTPNTSVSEIRCHATTLLALLKSAFDAKARATLPGGHVFIALWGSGDPTAYQVLHRAMLGKQFAAHRAEILTSASEVEPTQLVPLIGLILENNLLQDRELLESFLDVTALGKIFEAISAKKADRDRALAYLAQKLSGKPPKPVEWIDSWWVAWQAAIVDVDAAAPLIAQMTRSDDDRVRLAGLALASEARVMDLLKKATIPKAKSSEDRAPSLADILYTLGAMARAKPTLPEKKRKDRIVEIVKLYERAAGDPQGLKKLGKLKSVALFERIKGQLRRYWKDEPFTMLAAGYKLRPFELNYILPQNYVIPDDATARLLIDDMKLDFDLETLYEDTCLNYEKTFSALLRSNLSPAMWIHFVRRIHGQLLPLPPCVVEHLPRLPPATLTVLIERLSADASARHRLAGLKIALALKHSKHKALVKKLSSKFEKSLATDSDEAKSLYAELVC
jgi:hypothetical protein